jgi:hypothetical protein
MGAVTRDRLQTGEAVGEDPGHAWLPCRACAGQPVGTRVGGARRRPALDDGRARHPTIWHHNVDVPGREDAEVGEGELALQRIGHQCGDGEPASESAHGRSPLGQRVGYRVGRQASLEGDAPAGVLLRVLHRHQSQPRPGGHDQDRHDPDDGRQLGPNRPAGSRTSPLSAQPCPPVVDWSNAAATVRSRSVGSVLHIDITRAQPEQARGELGQADRQRHLASAAHAETAATTSATPARSTNRTAGQSGTSSLGPRGIAPCGVVGWCGGRPAHPP